MLRLSDFITCRKRYYNQSGGAISQLWNTVGRGHNKHFLCCHG